MENTHPSLMGKLENESFTREIVVNNNQHHHAVYSNDRHFQKYQPEDYLAIVDKRALERECLAQALHNHHIGLKVYTFGSLEEWRASKRSVSHLRAVLVNAGNRNMDDTDLTAEISELVATFESAAVVVVAENDDLNYVLKALEIGVRGYIPTTCGIEICMQAIELAIAGGKFVPASSVLALRKMLGNRNDEFRHIATSFTARQSAVAEGLRRGKANKIIAYELNLCESTVKVHIRNIMKKLGATNRTEVAYKISDMIPHETRF
ncbi:DNA-binding response regulator, NarL/FixJ family, contains REC and HTH domains [Phyllobacterium sp. YR620]|jgi:DNA-binding NarL/FixJ family response regulator|uniref:Response regulator transcription factor n=2 Tax=Phyllobacteriaceae TaxID=69277 RepID=A0A849VNC6_9HYPH|nr:MULTISPECIES: response regulator transcription factor [unclassified Phyllobacterium]NTS30916.1 response regulator transcription factor [Phyllobacterium pellucidum]SDP81384.1 DNA-binding response regulator, NarL/FixJ family, contains REC and HTH domains [Phyllobacterium sp. YR620]SFI66047.1 DNA-binding response regulator, NarL/FixJ family, contains REC and HTH domains [Phyllobacterium sp. CL33Tsu]